MQTHPFTKYVQIFEPKLTINSVLQTVVSLLSNKFSFTIDFITPSVS